MKFSTFLFLAIMLFSAECVYSQISIYAGSNFSTSTSANVGEDRFENTFKPGFQIGASYDKKFSESWGLQTKLLLMNESYARTISPDNQTNKWCRDKASSYSLMLPVSVVFSKPITADMSYFVDLGVFVSYGIGGKYQNSISPQETPIVYTSYPLYPHNKSRTDGGIIGGGGIHFHRFIFSIHAKYGLQTIHLYDKTFSLMVSIGYKLWE